MKILRFEMFLGGNLAQMMRTGSIRICSYVSNKFVVSQAKGKNLTDDVICKG